MFTPLDTNLVNCARGLDGEDLVAFDARTGAEKAAAEAAAKAEEEAAAARAAEEDRARVTQTSMAASRCWAVRLAMRLAVQLVQLARAAVERALMLALQLAVQPCSWILLQEGYARLSSFAQLVARLAFLC